MPGGDFVKIDWAQFSVHWTALHSGVSARLVSRICGSGGDQRDGKYRIQIPALSTSLTRSKKKRKNIQIPALSTSLTRSKRKEKNIWPSTTQQLSKLLANHIQGFFVLPYRRNDILCLLKIGSCI